jgi:SAM-dependent methyltransferase
LPEEFDSYASDYDALLDDPWRKRFTANQTYFRERKLDVLLALLKGTGRRPKDLRWLDVGCGRAELLAAGQRAFSSVTGCDVSTEMIRHTSSVSVVHQPDPKRLPFESSSFDLVTAVCVYHHVEPAARGLLLAETARVLTDRGVAVVFEHNPWNPITRLIVSRTPVDQHAQLLTASATRRLLAVGGLNSIATSYFLLLPPAVYRRASWVEHAVARVPLGGQYAVMGTKTIRTAPAT